MAIALHPRCLVNELDGSSIIFLLLAFFDGIYVVPKDKCYLDGWRKVIQDILMALSMPIQELQHASTVVVREVGTGGKNSFVQLVQMV